MAAGLGFKTFTTGEVLTAADTNGYLMQGVLVFASAAARDAAITSPQEGQCCYLKDTDAVLTYSGAAWVGFDDSNAIQNSIVDAKGDLVAASGADTPARLAVGNNGETLVADSAATTGLRYSATPSASNPILNAACEIAQRGTTALASNAATNQFMTDRWQVFRAVAGATFTRQNTSDTTNLPNIRFCTRAARDSGNTATNAIFTWQNLETINTIPFVGKTVTLSFYARAGANYSPTSSLLQVRLQTGTGTDQNYINGYTGSANPIASTATLTTTWQRFTYTGTIATSVTEMAPVVYSEPTGTAGANDYYEVTGWQIDIGSVALPFRTYAATIQGDLAACQRYFYRNQATEADAQFAIGTASTTSQVDYMVTLPVSMRTKPASVEYSNLEVTDSANPALVVVTAALFKATPTTAYFYVSSLSSVTQYRPYFLQANTSAGYIGFSAEL